MQLESLLTGMNMTLAGAVWGAMHALEAAVPWFKTGRGQRISALVPLFLGAIGGATGAVAVDPITTANKIVAGVMVGGVGMIVFKTVAAMLPGKPLDPAPAVSDAEPAPAAPDKKE
jgi:hypothetical protein